MKKKREDSKPELSPEQIRRILNEMRQIHLAGSRHSEEFVQSVRHLPPLERAEAWIEKAVETYGDYSKQEAVVYLVSRGYDCAEIIKDLVAVWKRDEKGSIEFCMTDRRRWNSDTGQLGEVVYEGMTYQETIDSLRWSPFEPTDFWVAAHGFSLDSEMTSAATMLRTVQWCRIGGFDAWWHRLAKLDYELAVQLGVDPLPAAFYLFNMCRSDYALELMPRALNRILEAIEIPDNRQTYPWRRWRLQDPSPGPFDHFPYAASLIFANERLRVAHNKAELLDQASEALLKNQAPEGYWRCWADDEEPAIQTTAMAVHALALRQPRGWELAVSAAKDWLWSVQDISGAWIEFDCSGSLYLTVLVLDALELAAGGTSITFCIAPPVKDTKTGEDKILSEIKHGFDELRLDLAEGFGSLAQGQAAICRHIESESRLTLGAILREIRYGRVEQGLLFSMVNSIRLALKHIQEVGLPIDEEIRTYLDDIYRAVNSDLTLQQKAELSIPIIPFLLEYRVELGAGVDLSAAWEELTELVQQKKAG